jgi:chromosome segregation ATPase
MAKKIVKEACTLQTGQSVSFVQMGATSQAKLRNMEVVAAVKTLAKKQHSVALSQLASRISAVMKLGGGDVFAKVKELITKMIAKLEKEAAEEASAKAYCDEETSKNNAKKAELQEDNDKLAAKIDEATSKSAELKSEVQEIQGELAALAKLQEEMDTTRADEKAAYDEASSDLEKAIKGVQGALDVLREYYGAAALIQQPSKPAGHESSGDAGGAIISMLEVAESDFSKNLAQANMEEEDAQSTYDKQTQENKTTKTMKEQDAKYKAAEAKSLDKTVSELSSDLGEKQTELDAVLEYRAKLDEKCVKKPETYEERKARREAEIKGLKDALEILETEAAFLQRPRHLRRMVH